MKKLTDNLKLLGTSIAIAGMSTCAVVNTEYSDLPGFSEKVQQGRTKNAIANVVGGIVAQNMYDRSNFSLNVTKNAFPDSTVSGKATNNSINSESELFFSNSKFIGSGNSNYGTLTGDIKKSEFDWNVTQVSPNTYEIGRATIKFDHLLNLNVENGIVSGSLERSWGFDWDIIGSYNVKTGEVNIEIDAPLTLGIGLEGKVNQL
jgi:hypothetical protein